MGHYHWKGWGCASVIHLAENREFSGQIMFLRVPLVISLIFSSLDFFYSPNIGGLKWQNVSAVCC